MLILKKINNFENDFNILISNMLNIELGYKKYDNNFNILPEPHKPTLIINIPRANSTIKLKLHTRYAYIYCILDFMPLESFVKQLQKYMENAPTEHLQNIITGVSKCTVSQQNINTLQNFTLRDIVIHDSDSIKNEHILDTCHSAFTWIVKPVTDHIFIPRQYNTIDQIIPYTAAILYDSIDILTHKHGDTVNKITINNMKFPYLSDSLKDMSDNLYNDQIGILVNHDTYELEFINQYSAVLCTAIQNMDTQLIKRPVNLTQYYRKKLLSNSTDCYLCKYPIYNFGYFVNDFTVTDYEDIKNSDSPKGPRGSIRNQTVLDDIYIQYIDPLSDHFSSNNKALLLCRHCMNIIHYLAKVSYDLDYLYVKILQPYKQLVKQNIITKKYSSLLDSFEIGQQSRVIKINCNESFYIIDSKDMKDILIKNDAIRESNLPLLPVMLFWFNSENGYV
jgi:hypothetical protein